MAGGFSFGERRRWLVFAALLAALIALRVYCAFTLFMNSDEPQHLHIVWAWTQGLVPYRDVFDNHAPLFQLLCAPLLAWLGERADIVALMRLAMIPLYVGGLWLTWYIGKVLWSSRVGAAAALLAAFSPIFFIVSVQFRPDDLWMLLWLAAVAAGISPKFAQLRAVVVGLLVGAAFAVSLKSVLLVVAAAIAAVALAAMQGRLRPLVSKRVTMQLGGGVLAALVVPALFAGYFAGVGAWHQAVYCVFSHNMVPDLGRRNLVDARILLPLLGYPLVVGFVWWTRKRDAGEDRWTPRAWLLLSSTSYLLILYGFWPLITHQDLLPAIPLLAVCAAAAIVPANEGGATRPRIALALAFAGINVVNMATAAVPTRDMLAPEQNELARVLMLTRAGDPVMDAKGEAIFRRRPVYWAMEDVTEARMRDGLIVDDIAERLAATATPIVIVERLSAFDQSFVRDNYLPVEPHDGLIRVAGQSLGHARTGAAVPFDVRVPLEYAIVAPGGPASGVLDGAELNGGRMLAAGRHVFVPSADGELALVWAPALQRGLEARELFAESDR